MRLVLASASPRRADLLRSAGLDFSVLPGHVDESRFAGEPAAEYVARVATSKARAVASIHPGDMVLAADTAVVLDGDVLGKPEDAADAARMLRRLSGRAHVVLTGVTLLAPNGEVSFVDATRVWLAPLSEDDIAWYVASGEPMDKAGAYAVQGLASRFVVRIDGSYANVVGLPVARVAAALKALEGGRAATAASA
jgi:septum formation protein